MATQEQLLQAILTELKAGRATGGPKPPSVPGPTDEGDYGPARAEVEKDRVKTLRELNEELDKSNKKHSVLSEGISRKYNAAMIEQSKLMTERSAQIKQEIIDQEELIASMDDATEAAKRLAKEGLAGLKDQLDEVAEQGEQAKKAIGAGQGLASEVSRLGQSLLGVGDKAGSFSEKMGNWGKKIGEVGAESGDAFGDMVNGVKDMGKATLLKPIKIMVDSTLGLIVAQDAAISAFRRGTGAGKEYNLEITALERSTYDAGISAADAGKTYQTLYTSMSSFTQLNKGEQRQIAKTTALLETQGVATGTSAKIMDQMTRSLGKSAGESNDIMLRLAGSAKSLGVPMGKMADDFAASFGELAKYGDGAIDVFEGLAVQAKKTGLEVGDLMKIAGQFDTFESAATSVGKLNAIMGGPYLNSIDMLNASEEERIELLRNTVQASGMQFDAMNRFEKQAMASAMGVSVDEASRIMKMSTAEMELQAMKQEELEENARNSQEMMEMLKNAFQALALDIRPFFEETIIPMIEGFAGMAKGFGEFLNKLGQFVKVGLLAAGIAALIAAPFTGGASIAMYAAIAGLAAGGIAYAAGGPKTRGTADKKEKEEVLDLEGLASGGTVRQRMGYASRPVEMNERGKETAILPVGTYVANAKDTQDTRDGLVNLLKETRHTNQILWDLLQVTRAQDLGATALDAARRAIFEPGAAKKIVKKGLQSDVVTPFDSSGF